MNRLKSLRLSANITQDALCKYVLIRRSALSDIENNKQPMREVHLRKLTSFFDVTSDYLLGYSNTGIGIYFDSAEDGDEHAYISASELERLKEDHEVNEIILHHPETEPWVIRTSVSENVLYRNEYVIYRYVNVSKEKAHISVSLRDEIIKKLNTYDTRELEKILKFMKDYIDD